MSGDPQTNAPQTAENTPGEYPEQRDEVFSFDRTTEYRVRERVFRPDCFEVQDEHNNIILSVVGKVIDRSGAKVMFWKDTQQRLFKMNEQWNSWLQRMYMFEYSTKQVFTIQKKGFLPFFGRGVVLVWKGKGTDSTPWLQMNSSGGRSRITVTEIDTGRVWATMKRSMFGPRRLFTGADYYRVSVRPGVPVPFVMMLCVCADEQYTDFNR